jgi:hypothetical protein
MCPVHAAAKLISSIYKLGIHPAKVPDLKINTVLHKGSHGVSSKMITFEEFYTVPDIVHNAADSNIRTRNRNNLASTNLFSGSHTNIRRGLHPAFHLEH